MTVVDFVALLKKLYRMCLLCVKIIQRSGEIIACIFTQQLLIELVLILCMLQKSFFFILVQIEFQIVYTFMSLKSEI